MKNKIQTTFIAKYCFLLLLLLYSSVGDDQTSSRRYNPDWKDLDSRPLPEWYDRAKIGIFLHWGIYSSVQKRVTCFSEISIEWLWLNFYTSNERTRKCMEKLYPKGFKYYHLAPNFTAKSFNPNKWADLFVKAGAKYVVLTSKHHDGFKLYSSNNTYFAWNSLDVGPRRDLVKDLSTAVREKGLEFGVYYSLYEWFNPLYIKDAASHFSSQEYVKHRVWPDIMELVNSYHPSILWSDGDWDAPDKYWKSKEILAWLYNDSPVKDKIVVNDRWGKGVKGMHGDFFNYADRFNPGVLQDHKWENAMSLDKKSWGFRSSMKPSDMLTTEDLIYQVVSTVSCGGNILINVGPTEKGVITQTFQTVLLELGKWLSVNGEAIYGTSPWFYQRDNGNAQVWYTCKKNQYDVTHPIDRPKEIQDVTAIYAIILKWPQKENALEIKAITSILRTKPYNVKMLGHGTNELNWTIKNDNNMTNIYLPEKGRVLSKIAWALKFTPV